MGERSALLTSSTSNLVAAINDLFVNKANQSALAGKANATDIGVLNLLDTHNKSTIVGAINELVAGGSGGGSGNETFTFVIDSDDALAAWAENTPGGDYSSVYIKSGTWQYTKHIFGSIPGDAESPVPVIDLNASGTKLVCGEKDSLLSFTVQTNHSGVYAAGLFGLGWDCRIYGAAVEMIPSGSAAFRLSGFSHCNNLINCKASVTGFFGAGFSHCDNLISCEGFSEGEAAFWECNNLSCCTGSCSNTTNTADACAYFNCQNLVNCYGLADASDTVAYAFGNCDKLVNCKGEANSANSESYGFYTCTNLLNCEGQSSAAYGSYGFFYCQDLTNCTGMAAANNGYFGVGFYYCNNLSHCSGAATSSHITISFAFCECIKGFGNRPIENFQGYQSFMSCCMNQETYYPWEDTAEGGYNAA
jgi:hypothetical protein